MTPTRTWVTVAAAVAVLGAAASGAAQGRADLAAARSAYLDGRLDEAAGLLTRTIEAAAADVDLLAEAHWNRAITYNAMGEKERAFADFEAFATLRPEDPDGPSRLVEVGVELGRFAEAARALATLADVAPGRVRERRLDILLIARAWQLRGDWTQAGAVLEHYARVDQTDAAVNVSRARTAAALGRTQEALELVRRSSGQHNLVLVRADRTFAALWDDPAFAEAADLTALYERDLAQARSAAAREPDRLFNLVLQMSALWRLGRFDEAVALGRQLLSSDLSRFVDRDYREAQLHEQLARALTMTGDLAGAEQVFRAGVDRLAMRTETVVTLMMSAGQFLAATAGKYRDALDYADRADALARTIYGTGIGDSVRALAYWGLRQQSALDRILAQVEGDIDGAQAFAIEMYLLQGRVDEAARLVVRQLADPGRVDGALVGLQRYTKNRPPAGAVEQQVEAGWSALRRHPAVLAALEPIGRIVEIPAANRF